MPDMQFGRNPAKSLGEAMRSAIAVLRPHYTMTEIAAPLKLGRDNARGEKPKAKALRDFLNERRTNKRLSPVWVDFAYEIRAMLIEKSKLSEAIKAEVVAFSAVLETYLLKFHALDPKHFLSVPHLNENQYRFRIPKIDSELICFGTFSDREPDIANANPGLFGEKRLSLYREWFDIRRDAFLILDKINSVTGNWDPIAVSIMLPLSAKGAHGIRTGEVKAVVKKPDGSFSSGLSEFIVGAGEKDEALQAVLLDTWIVKRKDRWRSTVPQASASGEERDALASAREAHQKWAGGLLMKHISILTGGRAPLPILIEPDYWHIRHLCRIWNFDAERNEQLWIVSPSNTGTIAIDLLWYGVSEAENWDVTG